MTLPIIFGRTLQAGATWVYRVPVFVGCFWRSLMHRGADNFSDFMWAAIGLSLFLLGIGFGGEELWSPAAIYRELSGGDFGGIAIRIALLTFLVVPAYLLLNAIRKR